MKAILRPTESDECVATSYSGKRELRILKDTPYDFLYDSEDNFYLVVDDVLYQEVSTAFDFVD